MKIAILASKNGEKALYIHQFFKEGNRVETDCVITDVEDSPLALEMESEGVATYYFEASEWAQGEEILRLLRERGVEIVVVDGLDRPIPPAVVDSYGQAVAIPTSKENSPAEIVDLYNRLTKGNSTKKEEKERDKNEPPTMEEEWAEVLKVHYDEQEAREAQEAHEAQKAATPPPPVAPVTPEVIPAPTPGGEREPMPDTFLIWSVLATIFCCLIPGIVAIIMSSSVSSKYFNGDIEGAKRASRRAQIWIIVSVITGIVWFSLYLPLMLLAS